MEKYLRPTIYMKEDVSRSSVIANIDFPVLLNCDEGDEFFIQESSECLGYDAILRTAHQSTGNPDDACRDLRDEIKTPVSDFWI
jgi:hypothetical protein